MGELLKLRLFEAALLRSQQKVGASAKKLLGARASLLGARTLLRAPGLTTWGNKLLGARYPVR